MKVQAFKTRKLLPPKDDLFSVLEAALPEKIEENSILAVTSKVVAIHQGRCVKRDDQIDERELIRQESDLYLADDESRQRPMILTIKDSTFIPKAGIDTSNGNGYFILWPEASEQFAQELLTWLKEKYQKDHLGVIIVDSGLIPLRWGTVGISLASAGFCPLIDYRQQRDVFNRKSLSIVCANVVDSLAAAANLEMGEGEEQTPLALISDVPYISFEECPDEMPPLKADPTQDLFAPLIATVEWEKGGGC